MKLTIKNTLIIWAVLGVCSALALALTGVFSSNRQAGTQAYILNTALPLMAISRIFGSAAQEMIVRQGRGLTAGSTAGGVNFALEGGGQISGTVTDASTDNPLENLYVNIYDTTDAYVGYGRTNAAGQYTSVGLPTGTY